MQAKRNNFEVGCGLLGAAADFLAGAAGVWAATWIRFASGWVPLHRTETVPPMGMYAWAAWIVAALLVFVFRQVGLYRRPQLGSFGDRVPRLVRGLSITFGAALALASVVRIEGWPPYSRTVVVIAYATVMVAVFTERLLLFRAEWLWAKKRAPVRRILIVGTGRAAARLRTAMQREPRLRARLAGYLRANEPGEPEEALAPGIEQDDVKGDIWDLERVVESERADEIILADPHLSRARLMQLLTLCEQRFLAFRMVPDLYGILTTRVQVQHVSDVPLISMAAWPLDAFWNRFLKRTEDVLGSLVGLVLSVPIVAVAAPFIKRSSPGPVFYRQERCGLEGKPFTLYKLRTMPVGSEAGGPVWTRDHDPRRTRVGRILRKWNLDELPQFWNVLKGEMSLVGPRPERPFFVEQFKREVGHYMARHASRPGMTGWAQVNGLRGDTSIRDRVQHDLYYLENWSLSFDLKILVHTFFTRENAY
ncbi:MAG: undecaprenyl-phosphate glucose phosphotransferase [Kiritimatiellae bacterium]|nr:undecaprenyl-phosphate glucose phosphotransferase [Kiritimatiellia bacterium]